LPDDYGGLEGQITVAASGSTSLAWYPVDFMPIGRLYQQYAQFPVTTGRPQMCCQEPLKGTSGLLGQQFRLKIWPVADQAYTIQFQYYLNPDALTGAFPYCYGGAQHAETILESCLAIAEERLDDTSEVHGAKFKERLAASISKDRTQKPQKLGYNRDCSDYRYWGRDGRFPDHVQAWITVDGVQY
jgi:hypothetical protein